MNQNQAVNSPYCENCKYYPDCDELDGDTQVFECDYKVLVGEYDGKKEKE